MLFPLYVLNPRLRFPLVTLLVIATNISVMGGSSTFRELDQSVVAAEYGFVPARLTHLGERRAINVPVQTLNIWGLPRLQRVKTVSTDPRDVYVTFLTTQFLHGGWFHLLMNMWTLWLFGPNIEDRLGRFVFLMFYILGGVVATLTFWLSDPQGHMPVIGASGAVAAVLGAYAVTFPMTKVRTLVFFILITDHRSSRARVPGHLVFAASNFRNDGPLGNRYGAGCLLGAHRRLRGRNDSDAAAVVRCVAARHPIGARRRTSCSTLTIQDSGTERS